MREQIRKVLLWLWPKIRVVYARCELQVDLLDQRTFLAGLAERRQESSAAELAKRWTISGAHAHGETRGAQVPGAHVWLLLGMLFAVSAQAAPDNLAAVHNAFRGVSNPFYMGEPMPQGGGTQSGPAFRFDGSYNLLVNCITGCSASSGFTDNSLFTVSTSVINPIGALYSTSTPAIGAGNAGRVRMDANSYLLVDCITGCSASAGFADNSAFTAGTTAIGITGGWYSTSPTNCTSGNACAPSMTSDRKMFVQSFQGTSPWIVDGAGGTFPAMQSGTWTVQPGNTANTTAWLVTGTGGTFPATQSGTWNVGLSAGSNTIGKVGIDQTTPGTTNAVSATNFPSTVDTNTGNASASTIREALATNNPAIPAWGQGATGAAVPGGATQAGGIGSGATGGELIGIPVSDTYAAIDISTATTTLLVTGVAGRQVRIGAIHFIAAGADNVALIEGTGATCGTGTAGMAGGTTAATGYNFVANQGYTFGSGLGAVISTVTAGDSVCAVTSAAVQLSGGIEYTIY